MLAENLEITTIKGEYRDFPYRKTVYLYGKAVWTDDFADNISDKEVVDEFCKAIKEAVYDYEEIYE